jgi:hypothetical protein
MICVAGTVRRMNMDREIIKLWSGPIEDLPDEYSKDGIPAGFVNVTVYSDGSRIYDKGFTLSKAFRDRINFHMGKCWDSLSREDMEAINRENDREEER